MKRTLSRWFTALLILLVVGASGCIRDIEVRQPASAGPLEDRSAILILPGLGDSPKGRRHMKRFAQQARAQGYDVFIPDYIGRKSVADNVNRLERYIQRHGLRDYDRVHVLAYIMGSYTFGEHQRRHPMNNIASVVLDRSPWQERAPAVVVDAIPGLVRLGFGNVVHDLAKTPYPTLDLEAPVGLLIETERTRLIRRFDKRARAMGPVGWTSEYLEQPAEDAVYVPLDHDEMYVSFGEIGPPVLHFFEHGTFPTHAERRTPDRRDDRGLAKR